MDIRKSIESLVFWYVLSKAIILVLGWYFTKEVMELIPIDKDFAFWSAAIQAAIHSIDNFTMCIWLYLFTKGALIKRILWASFGFVGVLNAALVYLVLLLIEKNEFNKASQKDAA